MQPDTNWPNSALTEENSLQAAMYSHGYGDSVFRQSQNSAMAGFPLPFSLGEAINPHEFWNVQSGRNIVKDFSNGCSSSSSTQDIHGVSLTFACPKSAVLSSSPVANPAYESTTYGLNNYPLHKGDQHASCSSNSLSLNFNTNDAVPFSQSLSPGSIYLPAVQEILAEIACYTLDNFDHRSYSASVMDDTGNDSVQLSSHRFGLWNKFLQEREVEAMKKHLMSLLQVVDEQYSQCLDEIHTVVCAFHAVTELDPGLHARFALPMISLMYKNLRERISHHILELGAHYSEGETREDKTFEASFVQKQWALQQQLKKRDHQLWKPQRGLPERSVSVLRAWMFQNFLHPYPKDAEKHLLAMKSGLTRSQVSNWFINARVRLWKPMIEEMYAEMNRRKANRSGEESDKNNLSFENRRYTLN